MIWRLTWNGSAKPILTITKTSAGALTKDVITASSTKTQVWLMYSANVATVSALDAVMRVIGLLIAVQLRNGKWKILLRVKTSLGSWPTLSSVLNAGSLLKRTRDVITWHARCAHMSSAGYAKANGQSMVRRLEDTITVTSMRNWKPKEMERSTRTSSQDKQQRMN